MVNIFSFKICAFYIFGIVSSNKLFEVYTAMGYTCPFAINSFDVDDIHLSYCFHDVYYSISKISLFEYHHTYNNNIYRINKI